MAHYNTQTGIYTRADLSQPMRPPLYPHTDFVKHMLSQSQAASMKKVSLVDGDSGKSLSAEQIFSSIQSLATKMQQSMKIKQGDVVMILLPNSLHFPIVFHAIISLGALATAINPDPLVSTAIDIEKQIKSSGSKLLFTNKAVRDTLGCSFAPYIPVVLVEEVLQIQNDVIEELSLSSSNGDTLVRVRQSDPAALLYSSGTTGVSKGVITSHGNLIAAMTVTANAPDEMDDPDDVILVLFPMCSMGGLVWLACAALLGGPQLVFLPRYHISSAVHAIHKYKVTKITCAPPVALDLLNANVDKGYDLSSLRTLLCAGAPLSKDTMKAVLSKFPHIAKFIQLYGMTESTTLASGGAGPLGSVGRLSPYTEAKVVDLQTGKPLPPNHRGELLLRGPSIMQGYLNNPVSTAQAIDTDGWLHTGDAVYFDEEGYLYVVERLKEYIKYKGSQVAPAELEAILLTHPDIADCAVVPFPDKTAGEIPLACVVKSVGKEVTSQQVMDFVASQVSSIKQVRKVVFLDRILKSATGKILRKELKLQFASVKT